MWEFARESPGVFGIIAIVALICGGWSITCIAQAFICWASALSIWVQCKNQPPVSPNPEKK